VEKILVKFDEEACLDFGRPPEERSIEEHVRLGFVNLDKPAGPTSHQVTSWVKNILGVKKAGHSGTLDPQVTGVLPIGIMDSAKVLQTLLVSGKEYVGVMKLHGNVDETRVREVFNEFTGEIYQKPPLKSAVKRRLRTRRIYELELLEKKGTLVLFRTSCQAGTYIRKLCHDIGLVLGPGANMQRLRRTKAGSFKDDTSVILHDLADAVAYWRDDGREDELRRIIVSIEDAVSHLPRIWLRDSAVSAIAHGAPLNVPGVAKLEASVKRGGMVALFTLRGELAAIARAKMDAYEISGKKNGEAAALERVVIAADAYPRQWKKKGLK